MMVVPSADQRETVGIDSLGAIMSIPVTLVACLAGHIMPVGVWESIDAAKKSDRLSWVRNAATFWQVPPEPWFRHLALVGACVAPLAVLVTVLEGPSVAAVSLGLRVSLWWTVPPTILAIALHCLVLRRYGVVFLILMIGAPILFLSVRSLVSSVPISLAGVSFLAGAAVPWVILLRSCARQPARGGRWAIPRTVRASISRSLRREQSRLMRSHDSRWTPGLWLRLKAWLLAATGRTSPSASKPVTVRS